MSLDVPSLEHDDTSEFIDLGLAGGTLHGAGTADSTAQTAIGPPEADTEQVALDGVPGSLAALHGVRGRTIMWTGALRVTTGALASVRTQLARFAAMTPPFTFTDDDGTEYGDCRMAGFEIGTKQHLTGGAYTWRVPYRIVLFQLVV